MIMQTGGNNNTNNQQEEYNVEEQNQVQEQYYEESSYTDETKGDSKKILIIGGIVVGIILILLLFFIFGGKKKTNVDSNNNLKNIVVEGAYLEPDFNQDVLEYELKTTSDTIRIICQSSSENAVVEGCDLGELSASELAEDIEIVVRAANGDEKKYIIKVNEGYEGIKFTVSGNDKEWSNKDVTLTVDATSEYPLADEAYSFDDGVTWQKDKSKTFKESTNVIVRVRDNQGHVSASQTIEVKIDKNDKVLINKVTGESDTWTDKDVTLTVDATSENKLHEKAYSFDEGKTWQSSNTKTFTTMSTVNIIVRDEKENLSKVKKVQVRIDKTTPTVKITGSTASGKTTTGSVVLKAETNNSPSGYKYQWYKNSSVINGATKSSYTATTSGSYTVKVTSGVGKSKTSSAYTVTIKTSGGTSSNPGGSTTSGTVSITSVSGNPTNYTKSDVTLKVNATASKGLNSKAYSFDNGKTWQSSNSKTFKSNQTVYIKVRDKNDKTASKTVTINKIDKVAPEVSFSVNGSSAKKSVDTIVTVKDNGVGELGTLYYALSTSESKQPSQFSATFISGDKIRVTTSANSSGRYYLWIKAVDKLGNQNIVVSKVFNVDNQSPNVPTAKLRKGNKSGTVLASAPNSSTKWYNHDLWWGDFAGSDNGIAGIDHYEYSIKCTAKEDDTRKLTKSYLDSGFTYTTDYNKYFCLRAVDKAGNTSAWSKGYYVKIDKTAPTIKFNPSSANTYKSPKDVTATCTDSASGLVYMKTWDTQYSSDVIEKSFSATNNATTQKISLVSTGENRTITTVCKDAAGNTTGNKESPKFNITSSSSGSSSSSSSSSGNTKEPSCKWATSTTTVKVNRGDSCGKANISQSNLTRNCVDSGYWEGTNTICSCTVKEYKCN